MPRPSPIDSVLSRRYQTPNIDLGCTVRSPTVQRALPDLAGLRDTPGFDAFLANPPDSIISDPEKVRCLIQGYATQLERHERLTAIWKHQYENQLFSLRQLISDFELKRNQLNGASGRTLNSHDSHDASNIARASAHLGLPEFEDIYYLLACKTRSLYSDLQIRFASRFISLDAILHQRGPTTYTHEICTVRDLRNLLRAIWFHLLHPVIIQAIESAINKRKYNFLKAHPLVPTSFYQMSEAEQKMFDQNFKMGNNLDAPTVCQMFDHLDDISSMSIPAILDKVFKRRMGASYAPPLQNSRIEHAEHSPTKSWRASWIDIGEDEEDYIQDKIERPEQRAYTSEHVNSLEVWHDAEAQEPPKVVHPTRTSSLRKSTTSPLATAKEYHRPASPTTAIKVQKWLPGIPSVSSRDSPPATPRSKQSRPSHPSTPPTMIQSRHSMQSTPSNRRIPFLGDLEYSSPPPNLPPKSPEQHAQAAWAKHLRTENEQLKRENSQLQEALLHVRVHEQEVKRETSKLQDALRQVQASPSGLIRRMSKLGSRSRSKSPMKSPHKSQAQLYLG